jgi:hypothetical protein
MLSHGLNYYVVATAFHGGGLISRHHSRAAAERKASLWKSKECVCGCCGIVTAAEYDKLPLHTETRSPYALAR